MASHLRSIVVEYCRSCTRRATVELYNTQNGLVGAYCGKCGATALRRKRAEAGESPPTASELTP